MAQDRQPKGFSLLFFTELWERFGFYTLQTIIILFMIKGLTLSDDYAYLLYGTFSSMLYLTPVIGGYLADRYLGFQRSIIIGGVLLTIGYLLTAIPSNAFFFLGLSVVIVANGLFKPNVSSIVGDLYKANDARRDGGFTLFYMGINIGSLIPPLIAGWMVAHWGWHSGFLLAALGMFIGLITFILGRSRLRAIGALPPASPLRDRGEALRFYTLFYTGIVVIVGLMLLLFKFPRETDILLAIASILILLFVVYLLLRQKKTERNRLLACLILILISIGFWALYNQTFTSLMLYADRNMHKEFLGITIDAEFTQFFNPFFIILLSPMLSRLWMRMNSRGSNFSTPTKFSFGVLFMALGFFLLGLGGHFFSQDGQTSAWWLVVSYFLQTIGELMLSPIGLAMITALSPKHLVGMMMGVWFLTQSAAFAIGGVLATFASVPVGTSALESLKIYDRAFLIYGVISLILTVISFSLIPYLKRLIFGDKGMQPIK